MPDAAAIRGAAERLLWNTEKHKNCRHGCGFNVGGHKPADIQLVATSALAMIESLEAFCWQAEAAEREWEDGSITSDHMAFLLNCLIDSAKKGRAALAAGRTEQESADGR